MKLKENILIVDDDLSILELLHRHLNKWGFHVFKAISVKDLKKLEVETVFKEIESKLN